MSIKLCVEVEDEQLIHIPDYYLDYETLERKKLLMKTGYHFPSNQTPAMRNWVYRIIAYLRELHKPEKVVFT